jgi:hypothetical protein
MVLLSVALVLCSVSHMGTTVHQQTVRMHQFTVCSNCICRNACLEVESQHLSCLASGQPTTLQAFQEKHAARLAAAQAHLLAVVAQVVAAAKTACEAALAALEQQLMRGLTAAADMTATAR